MQNGVLQYAEVCDFIGVVPLARKAQGVLVATQLLEVGWAGQSLGKMAPRGVKWEQPVRLGECTFRRRHLSGSSVRRGKLNIRRPTIAVIFRTGCKRSFVEGN